jgi:demethylmenaquinone methyltransferase/2-methoxy-6-polyprenyl-1,4-benzoquinol methylase
LHDEVSGTVPLVTESPTRIARDLFAPLAPGYERWAEILSMGQDGRWRSRMIAQLAIEPGEVALDVAAGTGSITRLLQDRGADVVSLDQSHQMLVPAVRRGATGVVATAERLPFDDAQFDVVTFGYLLRYVEDVAGAMAELTRVVRPGGRVGMVEFGRPSGVWLPLWRLYTRLVLPTAGLVAGEGWPEVGRFLGPNIEDFGGRFPPGRLARIWEDAGLSRVGFTRLSLGGGLVMWAKKGTASSSETR